MNRTKPLVFIVDDVPENIQIAMSHLRELNCDFAYATSGDQALERISATHPDLVLMDVMMPGMSGFQVVEKLNQRKDIRSIPVIFLTARAESEDVVHGFSLGGVDYITKPFKGVELRSRVRNHLELHAYRSDLERLVEERSREAELLKDVII
jgi:putative two-component system response regulator